MKKKNGVREEENLAGEIRKVGGEHVACRNS